jgi:chromosome segregation ATPase
MMLTKNALAKQLAQEFTPPQAVLLSEVITSAYTDLVKTSDFNELKEIVRDLGKAQQRTEEALGHLSQRVDRLAEAQQRTEEALGHLSQRVDRLAEAQQRTEQRLEELAEAQQRTEQRLEELAEAQQRTEQRLEELAEAQQRTEQRLEELAEAQQRTEQAVQTLARGLSETRSELAGLGRQFGYALENEAYRALPPLLRERYQIEITRRFIRTYIGDQEINLLAEGKQNGDGILLVGEVKSHLGTDDFEQLERSVEVVRQAQAKGELPDYRIVPLFVAHVARPAALKKAEKEGVIVVQSFEW